MCIKHSNFEMMLTSLSRKQVISERNTHDLLEAITCSDSNVDCLMKKFDKCSNKSIRYTIPNASDSLTYHKWINVVEKKVVKGIERNIKIAKKNSILLVSKKQ